MSDCHHASYNASPSLRNVYYTFAFEKLFKSAYVHLASYYIAVCTLDYYNYCMNNIETT